MRTLLTTGGVVVLLAAASAQASAQTPPCPAGFVEISSTCYHDTSTPPVDPIKHGHIPYYYLGGAGLLGIGSDAQGYTKASGGGGIELELHADLKKALLSVAGSASVGNIQWGARANLVLGAWLGRRTSTHVTSVKDHRVNGDIETTTYEHHLDKRVPVFYGLFLGTSEQGSDNGITATIEGGFAVVTPQLQGIVAPLLDVVSGGIGVRWSVVYGLPVGSKLFYFRLGGDHISGNAPIGTVLTLVIGLGGSMGVGL